MTSPGPALVLRFILFFLGKLQPRKQSRDDPDDDLFKY